MDTGKITKTQWLLLGMTGVFLCGLMILSAYDRRTQPPVEMQIQVPQEELRADLSPLDLNSATAEELEALPGIGAELASRILEYRRTHGGFTAVEELMEVPGIGEGRFAALEGRITVEEQP